MLIDPNDPAEFGDALGEVADQATDVLLLYYLGHALISPSGELYLSTHATRHTTEGLAHQAFPFSAVRDALSDCRADVVAVVLDCLVPAEVEQPELVSTRAVTSRGYVLVSGAHEDTGFTAEFTRMLNTPSPRPITLESAYRHLARVIAAGGGSRPVRHAAGDAGSLLLAGSRAAAAGQDAEWSVSPGELHRSSMEPQEWEEGSGRPYPGLSAFEVEDAHVFFGREQLTAQLLGRVMSPSSEIVAVVGEPGSGKSSLLRAGLIATLPLEVPWVLLTLGADPVSRLRDAVPQADIPGQPEHDGLVLVIDQLEELFTGPAGGHERAAFADSRMLAVVDGTVTLWDLDVPRPLVQLGEDVVDAAFSPDGRLLATASPTTGVRLWDVETEAEIGHPESTGARAVAVSPTGRMLAVVTGHGSVDLHDLTDPAQPRRLHTIPGATRDLAFNSDGRVLVVLENTSLTL